MRAAASSLSIRQSRAAARSGARPAASASLPEAIGPGAMQLTVTPAEAYSAARERASPFKAPCRMLAETARVEARPSRKTTRPKPAWAIWGRIALHSTRALSSVTARSWTKRSSSK